MPSYAVVVVGLPARISSHVARELATRFSTDYVFRVPAAPETGGSFARYSPTAIHEALESCRDAVFGTGKRPSSFCQNRGQECNLASTSKRRCKQAPGQSCTLKKPEHLVLFYQAGQEETALLERLYHSALAIQIPQDCFGKKDKSAAWISERLKLAAVLLAQLKEEMVSKNSPLLLPPKNFGGTKIFELFQSAVSGGLKEGLTRFRQEYYSKSDRAFVGRRTMIVFHPADTNHQHGNPGPQNDASLALTHQHRLGCQYPGGFHFDVKRRDGRDLGGKTTFFCRMAGESRPDGAYVNILVDDCMRP